MKKLFFTSIFIAAAMASAFSQNIKKTDWEYDGLKGKVKSVTEISYEEIDASGKITKGKKRTNVYKYDENGNIIESSCYFYRNLYSQFIYKYDEKGNLIKKNTYEFDGILHNEFIYKYDDNGNQIQESNYKANVNLDWRYNYKIIYEYDDTGNITKAIRYEFNDKLGYVEIYEYKQLKKKIVEINRYQSNGRLASKQVFYYNNKGILTQENLYNPDGSLFSEVNYKYDDRENLIKKIRYKSDGSISSQFSYKYNDKEHIIEAKIDSFLGNNKYFYEYKYDLQDNWTEKTTTYKKRNFITTRTIEYYK